MQKQIDKTDTVDWRAWDYLDLRYAEESKCIQKNKSLLEWSILDSEPSGPKQQNHRMDSKALGGALSTDWFLLISTDFYWSVDSPRSSRFQRFPAQVWTKGAHAHLERCNDAWGPWWAASQWGHARPVAALSSDEERSLWPFKCHWEYWVSTRRGELNARNACNPPHWWTWASCNPQPEFSCTKQRYFDPANSDCSTCHSIRRQCMGNALWNSFRSNFRSNR